VTGYDVTASLTVDIEDSGLFSAIDAVAESYTSTSYDLQLSFSKSANYALDIIVPVRYATAPDFFGDADGVAVWEIELESVKDSSSSATNGFLDLIEYLQT